ncbi:family 16 glycosylhydrolase [Salibacter sp.]|uniref:family 16 glycosylhydrolase n=1 Tax=Salibacter sp. TaxID=2010995 RepID=UPI00286FEA2D|nr:family 16 glycosylhydrolase [Salibacter sp.]MDR9398140.1 family 16 glycosylhydrolase [Salibacter sp.]MDR9487546.1 family 16 glycosylhydrolase [Salibacter sp.]
MKYFNSYILVCICFLTINHCFSQLCNGDVVSLINNPECSNNEYLLVFEDNFDSTIVDENTWQFEYPWGRSLVENPEQQYYKSQNVEVNNGVLSLIAKRERVVRRAIPYDPDNKIIDDGYRNKRTFDFTSGMIFSKFNFGYGKYEIRCKIPKAKGMWPAFWLFEGPGKNEIDIFEFWNEHDLFGNVDFDKLARVPNFNLHHEYSKGNVYNCISDWNSDIDFSKKFHTFTLIWKPTYIEWYIDGQLKRRTTKYTSLSTQPIYCDNLKDFEPYLLNKAFPKKEYLHVIMNLAVQSNSNEPKSNSLPKSFDVDYFKFYKQVDCQFVNNVNKVNELLESIEPNAFNVAYTDSVELFENLKIENTKLLVVSSKRLPEGFTNSDTDINFKHYPEICNTKPKLSLEDRVSVFPNPSNGKITIQVDRQLCNSGKIYIINPNGYSMNTIEIDEKSCEVKLDLSYLNQGVYNVLYIQESTGIPISKPLVIIK